MNYQRIASMTADWANRSSAPNFEDDQEELVLETPFSEAVKSRPLAKVRRNATTASSGGGILPQDVYGRIFQCPVDTEHKATSLQVFSLQQPHMRTLYIHIFALFTAFMSVFTTSAVISEIREDLGITKPQIGYSGLMTSTGNVIMRVVAGLLCDLIGPRYTMSICLLLTAPAVFGMSLVRSYTGFCVCRFITGMQLGSFVVNQYVATTFFSTKVVGFANGIAAGWGNTGAGFIQILMPRILANIVTYQHPFTAWRLTFFIPGCFNLLAAFLVLRFTVDTPDGNYRALYRAKWRAPEHLLHSIYFGAANFRTLVLATAYGFSFGTAFGIIDSAVGPYLEAYFSLPPLQSASIGGSVGLMAFGFRPFGGFVSDFLGRTIGMRGRIWNLWVSQTLGAILAMILSTLTGSYASTMTCYVFLGASYFYAMGSTMGITPFISPRCQGVIIGLVGAGGTAGGAIITNLYFITGAIPQNVAVYKAGALSLFVSLIVLTLYWPMYGGSLFRRFGTSTEESYYLSDYTIPEIRRGQAARITLFAAEARSERGRKQAAEYEQNIRDRRAQERQTRRDSDLDGGTPSSSDEGSQLSEDGNAKYSELRPPMVAFNTPPSAAKSDIDSDSLDALAAAAGVDRYARSPGPVPSTSSRRVSRQQSGGGAKPRFTPSSPKNVQLPLQELLAGQSESTGTVRKSGGRMSAM